MDTYADPLSNCNYIRRYKTNAGKIYKISNNRTNRVYIGYTCDELDTVFMNHLNYYRSWSSMSSRKKEKYRGVISYKIFNDGFATIDLIEKYPCDHISELRKRTGVILASYPNAINKRISGRTTAEWKMDKQRNNMCPEPKSDDNDIHSLLSVIDELRNIP